MKNLIGKELFIDGLSLGKIKSAKHDTSINEIVIYTDEDMTFFIPYKSFEDFKKGKEVNEAKHAGDSLLQIKESSKGKSLTKIDFNTQDINDILSDEKEEGQSKTNFQRFSSIIKKHPLIKEVDSDTHTGAIILKFKGKKDWQDVYATPFYEGEKDIPIYIDKDGETIIDSKIVNNKTEFDSLEDFSNWYYNKIDEINKIAFPKEKNKKSWKSAEKKYKEIIKKKSKK